MRLEDASTSDGNNAITKTSADNTPGEKQGVLSLPRLSQDSAIVRLAQTCIAKTAQTFGNHASSRNSTAPTAADAIFLGKTNTSGISELDNIRRKAQQQLLT